MIRNLIIVRFTLATALVGALSLAACNPRELPGFKQTAKRQEDRITKQTEEAIEKSPVLKELDHFCTEGIPRPHGFVPISKYADFDEEKFLGYGYRSTLDQQSVKTFFINHLTQNGWQLAVQKDNGWGLPKIEFTKDKHRVTIFYMGAGEGANYKLNCGRL